MSLKKYKEISSVGAVLGLSAALVGTSFAATDSVSSKSQLAEPSQVVTADKLTSAADFDPALQESMNEVCRVAAELVREAQNRQPQPQLPARNNGFFDLAE
jgi:hypothetical protein